MKCPDAEIYVESKLVAGRGCGEGREGSGCQWAQGFHPDHHRTTLGIDWKSQNCKLWNSFWRRNRAFGFEYREHIMLVRTEVEMSPGRRIRILGLRGEAGL